MISNAKSEPAVSPVIGTILLVAIAVILVAIILIAVMGFSGDTNEKKVGLNAKPESGANATLILYGGASIPELVKLEMIDQDSPNGSYVKLWDIRENDTAFVGLPYLAKDVAQPLESMAVYDTRINVRGTFSDGSEVILLVQPMTFYDVGVNSDSRTNGLSINVPTAKNLVQKSGTLSFAYNNASSVPTAGTIYYKPVNSSGEAQSVPAQISGDANGTYSVTVADLIQGMEYIVWGEITADQGKVKGPEGRFTASSLIVNKPTFSGISADSVKTVWLSYSNAGSLPVNGTIYYRLAGSSDEPEILPASFYYTSGIPYGSYTAKLTGLSQNKIYEVWGEITLEEGGVFKGNINTFETVATNIASITVNSITSISASVWTTYLSATAIPLGGTIYCQKVGSDEIIEASLVSVPSTVVGGTGAMTGTLGNLEIGTEYIVWVELELAGGGTLESSFTKSFTTEIPRIDSFTERTVSGRTVTLDMAYSFADSKPTATLYYRLADSDGSWTPIDITTITYSSSNGKGTFVRHVTGLLRHTKYEMKIEMNTVSGTYTYPSLIIETLDEQY